MQRSYGNHSTAIVMIAVIVCVLLSERSQRLYRNHSSTIATILAIVMIVNDHMEASLSNLIVLWPDLHLTLFLWDILTNYSIRGGGGGGGQKAPSLTLAFDFRPVIKLGMII